MRKLFAMGLATVSVWDLGCGANDRAVAQPQTPAVQPAAAKLPAPDLSTSSKGFDGVWVPVSCQFDGVEQMKDSSVREAVRLSIENGQHKIYFLTDPVKLEGKRLSTATLTADEKARTFELAMTDGQKKGEKVHGIYQFDGDQMKLCYGPADKPRPTKFEGAKGSDVFNEVWTRHKKK